MAPLYRSHFISHRIKMGGDATGVETKVQAVLRGVAREQIISITHSFTPGMVTVLIVLADEIPAS